MVMDGKERRQFTVPGASIQNGLGDLDVRREAITEDDEIDF